MQTRRIGGFTLIELLTTLCIVTMLASAIPSFGRLVSENQQRNRTFLLMRLLQFARSTAISTNRVVTLCGSMDGMTCSKDWHSPTILIFDDRNDNHVLDEGEKIFYQEVVAESQWYWRGSDRAYLRFRADGSPKEWGHFTLCPTHKGYHQATQIILNFVGRPYDKNLSTVDLPDNEICS